MPRCEAALQELLKGGHCALGLDTEWADASGKVALLQIATREGGLRWNSKFRACKLRIYIYNSLDMVPPLDCDGQRNPR